MKKWMLLVLFLGAGLAWIWFNPLQRPDVPRLPPIKAESKSLDNLLASMDPKQQLEGKDGYFSIVKRPLFFHLRRPPDVYVPPKPKSKPKSKTKKKPPAKPNFKLSAIIVVGRDQYVLIRSGRTNETKRLRIGEDFDDWQLLKIGKDKVTLRNGADSIDLSLRSYDQVKPAPAKQGAGKNRSKPKAEKTDKRAPNGNRRPVNNRGMRQPANRQPPQRRQDMRNMRRPRVPQSAPPGYMPPTAVPRR